MSHQNQLNIKAVYNLATVKEREDGRLWYPQALQIARGLAARYYVSTECAAGVLAALSPRNKWTRNCVDAEALISTFKADSESAVGLKVCTFGANKAKALRILTENPIKSERVLEILSGPKLREFYSCIMGMPEVCTLSLYGMVAGSPWLRSRQSALNSDVRSKQTMNQLQRILTFQDLNCRR